MRSHTFLALLAPVLVAGCASIPGTQNVVLQDGSVLSGRLQLETLTVPAGATVRVDRDLLVRASGRIAILGRLVAEDRTGFSAELDAPSIVLESSDRIDIDGLIAGGRGYGFAGDATLWTPGPGGQGSSITLAAPEIWIDGQVRAGDGGRGALGFGGGAGGDVVCLGAFRTHDDDPARPEAVGGSGGASGSALAGQPAPAAGSGGSVQVREAASRR